MTYLHRLSATHPRAWVVNTLVPADDEEALRLLADSAFDLETRAVLATGEGGAPQQPTGELAPAGENSVEVERHAPNRFTLRVRSKHGGFLVLSENWMPGWQAWRTDGRGREAVPVLRANLTFLGLAVPAGESEWELIGRPASASGCSSAREHCSCCCWAGLPRTRVVAREYEPFKQAFADPGLCPSGRGEGGEGVSNGPHGREASIGQ
ncbi:MAG TPA: hypothetical protein VF707_13150 [Ardenticatenaceae bacterium]